MAPRAEHYDAVRYPGHFYPQASLDRLAVLGGLHGVPVAPVERCRVLELGCGDGGQLIPLAEHFPGSDFLGIDSSVKAIEDGRRVVEQLGLRNIRLVAGDIGEFAPDQQSFDYLICHGVLSWVPEPVREKILQLCSSCLAPHGVAYVSYDTLPGGYIKHMTRDLMRFHTRRIKDPGEKARAARDVVEFVSHAMSAPAMEREFFRREIAPYEGKDYFLIHDLLAGVDDPVYFLDFMEVATREGLQFLSEANPESMRVTHLPEPVRKQLETLPDRLEREQYLDFINLRRFRQTLLCRATEKVDLEVTPERLERLLISTSARAEGEPVASAVGPEEIEFTYGQAARVRLADPMAKALILALAEAHPRALRYSELRAAACRKRGIDPQQQQAEDDARQIRFLVASFANGLVALQAHQYEYQASVTERPAVSALTRHLAARGEPVVSRTLETFYLAPGLVNSLVPLLDGSRDFEGLVIDLAARNPERSGITTDNLERALNTLRANALLVG
jgi:SAM-dependent methyltransferase